MAFASDLVHSGPDTFFARVGKEAMIRTTIVPGAAHLIQRVCQHAYSSAVNFKVVNKGAITTVCAEGKRCSEHVIQLANMLAVDLHKS